MKCDNCAKRENCITRIEFIERMPFANIANCTHFKKSEPILPMTNGDRIRAMSDEELADRLYWLDKDSIPFCKNLPYCEHRLEADEFISDSECIACMLEWLKQPCSEVDHDTD